MLSEETVKRLGISADQPGHLQPTPLRLLWIGQDSLGAVSDHSSAPLNLFNEFLRFFEPNAGCLSVMLYRLNLSIGTQGLNDIVGHVSKGIEFDIGLLEQEIQLRFNPGHCPDASLKAIKPNPNC